MTEAAEKSSHSLYIVGAVAIALAAVMAVGIANAAVVTFSGIGLLVAWRKGFARVMRRRVRADEGALPFDRLTGFYTDGGEPLFLSSPDNTATLLFFDGFRVRTVAGVHKDWFESLHRDGVNVAAPIVGLQSMSYDLRNMEWDQRTDVREALQIFDVLRAVMPPGHRIVIASACFGVLPALAIAARRHVDAVVLLAPAAAGFGLPAGMAAWTKAVVATGVPDQLVPIYYRRSGFGGWDIVDPQRRELANRTWVANREWNVAQFVQLQRASQWMLDEVVPQVRDRDIHVVWGDQDGLVLPDSVAALADSLEAAGNAVRRTLFPDNGHFILMDRAEKEAKSIVRAALLPMESLDRRETAKMAPTTPALAKLVS